MLKRGAEPNISDNFGLTALDMATAEAEEAIWEHMKETHYVEEKLMKGEFDLILNLFNSLTQRDFRELFYVRDLRALDNLFLFLKKNKKKQNKRIEKFLSKDNPFYTYTYTCKVEGEVSEFSILSYLVNKAGYPLLPFPC